VTFFKYQNGRDIYTNVSNQVIKPNPNRPSGSDDADEADAFLYNHAALLSINRDAVGYIVIPGIDVQLPVVYRSGDNSYYLDHAVDGSESMFGTLFIDGNITDGFNSSHVLIHGHNMYDGSMFAGLAKYRNEDFARNGDNNMVYIYSEDKCYTYRIFSVHQVDPVDSAFTINFPGLAVMRDYASKMKQESMYDFGVPITNATQVLTLSTCTSDSAHRFVVHCVLTSTKTIEQS
ncbi:MAG: class B sortase, partial [Lachnospiraceae bacterium]